MSPEHPLSPAPTCAGSLVIPSYGRQAILAETVERFLADDTEGWEVIVVDQTPAPSAELSARAGQDPERLRYLHIEPPGLPGARNVGIRAARGTVVAFVDDDVIPDPGFLAAHLAPYADPAVGGVAGRIVEAVPRPRSVTGRGVGRVRRWNGRFTRNFHTEEAADVDFAPGGNMSFRRQVLLEVGGFDPRYGGTAHMEEADVGLRVTAAGWRLRFAPTASLTHLSLQVGGCRELDLARWLYWYGHNYLLFARKNLPAATFPLFLAERLAKLVFTALRHRRLDYLTRGLAGLRDGQATWRAGEVPAL